MSARQWYRIEAKAGADAADIYVYDIIGKSYWDDDTVTATKFIDELKALPDAVKTIRVHVNSPGGSVFEATAIANSLVAQRTEKNRTVETIIDGVAASAATIITSAGKPIRMADNAMMMIHDPSAFEAGPSSALRKMADLLDAVRDSIVATYRRVSSKSPEELAAMMAATTWMDAKSALANGFVTEITSAAPVTAMFDPKALNLLGIVPDEFKDRVTALFGQQSSETKKPEPEPEQNPTAASPIEVLQVCREGGCLELAEGFISAKASIETVRAGVQAAKEVKAAAQQRRSTIESLCKAARQPELAAVFVDGGIAPDAVRSALTIITAKLDKVEIDGSLAPSNGATGGALPWDTVFARMNPRN